MRQPEQVATWIFMPQSSVSVSVTVHAEESGLAGALLSRVGSVVVLRLAPLHH